MTDSVVVAGVGIACAVGLSSAETAAAVRAGTARFASTPIRDSRLDPITLASVPDDALPPLADTLRGERRLTARERRLLRLATRPMHECLASLYHNTQASPVGLCVALPEAQTMLPLDAPAFVRRLALQSDGAIDPARSDASHRGRAGGVLAVGQGVLAIQSGYADFIVVGGIDSYRDLFVLGALDAEERIKSEAHLDGFIPGEGAAFLLLTSARAAADRGLPVLARVSRVATGFEAGHLYADEPYRGDGLAMTLSQLTSSAAPGQPIVEVYSSMNGESHWAKEWGVAFIRNRESIQSEYRMHHPAECLGDTGAACGPLMIALAALGIRDRYRGSPALVYGSSDHGPRAAVVVSAS